MSFSIERNQRARKYRNDKKRFNVYINFHYANTLKKYDLITHCNVLMKENKHRMFKKNVYSINFINVERHLFVRENLKQTTKLLFLKIFKTSDSELTFMINDLQHLCFTLFDIILSKFEQQFFQKEDSFIDIMKDSLYVKLTALCRFQSKYCHNTFRLSIKSSQLQNHQINQFRKTYEFDYDMSNVMHFEHNSIM